MFARYCLLIPCVLVVPDQVQDCPMAKQYVYFTSNLFLCRCQYSYCIKVFQDLFSHVSWQLWFHINIFFCFQNIKCDLLDLKSSLGLFIILNPLKVFYKEYKKYNKEYISPQFDGESTMVWGKDAWLIYLVTARIAVVT